MSTVINTNLASLFAQNSLANAQNNLATSVQRLSSGLRINSAKDDAAGLSIAQNMQGQINGVSQSIRNLSDATNLLQVADSSLSSIQDMLLRMKQLTVQGYDGSLSASQKLNIVQELKDLNNEINATAQRTSFNGISLLTSGSSLDLVNTDIKSGASLSSQAVQVNTTSGLGAYSTLNDGANTKVGGNGQNSTYWLQLDPALSPKTPGTYTLSANGSNITLTGNFNGQAQSQTVSIMDAVGNPNGGQDKTIQQQLNFNNFGIKLNVSTVVGAGATETGSQLASAIVGRSSSIVIDGKGGQISNVRLSGANPGTYQLTYGNTGSISNLTLPSSLVSGQNSAGVTKDVALVGGSGTGATADISYDQNGIITAINLKNAGTGYKAGDLLSASAIANGTAVAPTIVNNAGAQPLSESATVTFQALSAGQSMNLGGLMFIAGASGATADQVANAFANLGAGATTGQGTLAANGSGSYQGTLTGWTTRANDSGKVTFDATTALTNVDDLKATATGSVSITTTQGLLANTETADVTFTDMKANQTVTIGGMVVTASGNAKASEVASFLAGKSASQAVGNRTGVTENNVIHFGALSTGQSLTIGGLTFTATAAASASDVESAFTNAGVGRTSGTTVANAAVTHGVINGTVGNWNITQDAQGAGYAKFTSSVTLSNVDDLTVEGSGAATIAGNVHTEGYSGFTLTGGNFSANWSSAAANGSTIRLTSATPNAAVQDLTSTTSGIPTIVSTQGGTPGSLEQATVTFKALKVGETTTIGGLVYTATHDSSASDVALAFANRVAGFVGNNEAQLNGTMTGTLDSNFGSGAASGATVVFTGVSNQNYTNLTVANTIATPTINVTTTGDATHTETTDVTFTDLAAGQSVTLNGLTFTASAHATAADVANAFSNTANDRTEADVVSQAFANGHISGTVGIYNINHTATAGKVTLVDNTGSRIVPTTVADSFSIPAPSVSTVDGSAITTESAAVTFDVLKKGQAISLGGLTYTATSDNTANEVAAAFGSLNDGAVTGVIAKGSFSGMLTGWSTSAASGSGVVFTSTSAGTNVDDLTYLVPVKPTVVTHQGNAARSESAKVTFNNMAAGETLTLGGLTFIAGANGATAAQVATSFSSMAAGSTTGAGTLVANGSGSYTGTLTGWTSGSVNGDGSVTFSSTTASQDVTDLSQLTSGNVSISKVDGNSLSTATAQITFAGANMSKNDTITLGGLTFTANRDGITGTQLADLFANIPAGTNGNSIQSALGSFTGTLSDWNFGTALNGVLAAVSTTQGANVPGLTANATQRNGLNALEGMSITNLGSDQTGDNLLTISGVINGRMTTQSLTLSDNKANGSQTINFDSFGIQFDVNSFQAQSANEIGAALASLNSSSAVSGSTGAFKPGQIVVGQGANSALKFQSGANTDAYIQIDTINVQTGSDGVSAGTDKAMIDVGTRISSSGLGNLGALGLSDSIDTWQTAFKNAADAVDQAVEYVSTKRATYGSQMNRLSYISTNLTAQSTNLQNSRSAIMDTDFASETAKLTKGQIMQQAATAMLAQANQMPNVILSLLK